MTQKKNWKEMSVADQLIGGLEMLVEAVESGEDLTERYTCHKLVLDLEPTQYNPQLVLQTRQVLQASQAIFAQFLGVSVNTVRAWEQGAKEPREVACRFMDEIRHDPKHWQERLRSSVKPKASTTTQ